MFVLICKCVHTFTDKIHTCVYIQKKKKNMPFFSGQKFSCLINSNRTFTDTNPAIKKDHTLIKTIFSRKARNKEHPNHYQSPEEGHKVWNTCWAHICNNENINAKFRFILKYLLCSHWTINNFFLYVSNDV